MNVSRRLFGPYLGARILTRNLHRTNSHRIADRENELQEQVKDQKTSPKKASFGGGVLSYLDPGRYFLAMGPLSALLCNDPHWFVLLDDEKEKALHVRRKSFVSLAAKAALWDKEDMYRVYVLKAKG
jgi:hypothetical protein